MSFSRNLRGSILAMSLTTVVGLAALGLMARRLGPDEFGGVALILAIFNFLIFFDGTRAVIVKLWHRNADDRPGIFGTSLGIAAAVGALLFLASILLIPAIFDVLSFESALAIGVAVALHMPLAVFWGILDANERIAFTALLRAVAWSVTYVAFIAFAWLGLPLEVYATSLALMNLFLCLVMALAVAGRGVHPRFPESESASLMIGNSMSAVGFNFLSAAMTAWDRLVLAVLMPIGLLGIYSIQVELGVRGRVLVNTFSRVLYPRLARQFEEQDSVQVAGEWLPYIRVLMAGILSVCLAIAFFAEPFLFVYAGAPYAEYSFVLVAVMAMLPVNSAGLLAMRVQRAELDFRTQQRAYGVALLIGIVAVWPAVQAFGIAGATAVFCLLRLGDLYIACRVALKYSGSNVYALLTFLLAYCATFALLLSGQVLPALLAAVVCMVLLLDRNSLAFGFAGLRRLAK